MSKNSLVTIAFLLLIVPFSSAFADKYADTISSQ